MAGASGEVPEEKCDGGGSGAADHKHLRSGALAHWRVGSGCWQWRCRGLGGWSREHRKLARRRALERTRRNN